MPQPIKYNQMKLQRNITETQHKRAHDTLEKENIYQSMGKTVPFCVWKDVKIYNNMLIGDVNTCDIT
jgi:hypothetical protein